MADPRTGAPAASIRQCGLEHVERLVTLLAPAFLKIVHELDQARHERCRDADLRAEGDDRPELRIRLGAATTDGEVAPDPAVGLRRLAVERDHVVERTL